MKLVLISAFFNILSTSLQEENPGRFHSAHIYNGGVNKVNESEHVVFKCKADYITDSTNTTEIYMYLFKNGEKVKMEAIHALTRDDTTFHLTKLTVEHSGLYTCLYSEEKLSVSETNATGHNSISLEVLGKISPAKIQSTETSVEKGEALTLTCTFTKNQTCTQIYVYLSFNGIGKSKKQVNCSHVTISTTFHLSNVSEKSSGNYSCVYSVSDYNLSEVSNTGENTIFIQVHEKAGFDFGSLLINVSVAASVVLLVLLGFFCCRIILSCRVRQDPAVRSTPNNEPLYYEITTGTLYTNENGGLKSSGGSLVEILVDSVSASYSTIQIHEGKQPVDVNMEPDIEEDCYDSVKVPYAAVQRHKASAMKPM